MTVLPKEPSMKQTIALVDDDRNILTSIQMTLEQEGFQVRTYTDGESALQGLNARPVDLAVLDIEMPRMDGMELLQRLRQRSSMPVIFLTSKDEEVDELMGLRLGADDYITKPFSQRLLIERIRALLRRNEASRAEISGARRISVSWTTPMSGCLGFRCVSNRNRAAPAPRMTTASARIANVRLLLLMASLAG